MATRFYLRHTPDTTAITPTPSASWDDTSLLVRSVTSTTPSADAMATESFSDADATDKDILFHQYISEPLTAGQTVTGGQALAAQIRISETGSGNNLRNSIGIRVIAADGTTVQKTVLALLNNGLEAATSLTNRTFSTTSAATNYTTQAGDRLVIEIGLGGDPLAGSSHSGSMRLGDADASDLPASDGGTTDNRPWVQMTDSLTFASGSAAVPVFMNQYRQRWN